MGRRGLSDRAILDFVMLGARITMGVRTEGEFDGNLKRQYLAPHFTE